MEEKQFIIKITKSSTARSDKDYFYQGTLADLVEYFKPRLQTGQKVDKGINLNPITIPQLVMNLQKAYDARNKNAYTEDSVEHVKSAPSGTGVTQVTKTKRVEEATMKPTGYIKPIKSEYDPAVPNIICPLCTYEGPAFDKDGKLHQICPKCKSGKLDSPTETDKQYESRIKGFGSIISEQEAQLEQYSCPKCKAQAVAEKGKPLKTTKCQCGGTFVKAPAKLTEYTTTGELDDISDLIDDAEKAAGTMFELVNKLSVKFSTEFEDAIGNIIGKSREPGGETILNAEQVDILSEERSRLDGVISEAYDAIEATLEALKNAQTPGDVTQ